jgi:hypothetical protein
MAKVIHGILPAAGQAMRLRRLPKFLLPCDDNATTLIEKHIEVMESLCDIIWLPVRPDLIPLVHDLNLGSRIIPIALSTKSMTETVLRIGEISGSENFLLGMPDTAFIGENPYARLVDGLSDGNLSLALWKTAPSQKGKVGSVQVENGKILASVDKDLNSEHPYHWGAMSFNRNFLALLNSEMPHTGYGIRKCLEKQMPITSVITKGEYFDCGTFGEYKRYINAQLTS